MLCTKTPYQCALRLHNFRASKAAYMAASQQSTSNSIHTFGIARARKLAIASLDFDNLLDVNAALLVLGLPITVYLGSPRDCCAAHGPPEGA